MIQWIAAIEESKVDGDTMGGDVSFEGAGDGTWSATRAKD